PGQSLELPAADMSLDFVALTRHLNANQVLIHALQASGLRVADSMTAGSKGFAVGHRAGQVGTTFDSAQRTSERRGMATLADETGGRLVVNQNSFDAELESVGRELQSYYSLAYEPPRGGAAGASGGVAASTAGASGSGAASTAGARAAAAEHRIGVTLADGALQARYRRGYAEKDADQRLRESL